FAVAYNHAVSKTEECRLLLTLVKRRPKHETKSDEPSRRSPQANSRGGSILGFLTVGQTARILGISPSLLRQLENIGLITPARSQGRFRLYSPELLKVLKRIKYLRDVEQLRGPGLKYVLEKTAAAPQRPASPTSTKLGLKLRRLRKKCNLSLVEAAR